MKHFLMSLALAAGLGQYASAQIQFPMNIFVGRDADSLKTTFRGLGSTNTPVAALGLPYSQRLGTKRRADHTYAYVHTGLFVRWVKFRFDDDRFLISRDAAGQVLLGRDTNAMHNYDRPYSKSKLVCTYFNLPIGIGFSKGLFFGDVTANFDVLMGGRAKRKFYEGETKTKVVDRFRDNEDFGLRPFQVGLGLRAGIWVIFVYGSYNVTPFFRSDQPWQVNAASFGIGIDFGRLVLFSKDKEAAETPE